MEPLLTVVGVVVMASLLIGLRINRHERAVEESVGAEIYRITHSPTLADIWMPLVFPVMFSWLNLQNLRTAERMEIAGRLFALVWMWGVSAKYFSEMRRGTKLVDALIGENGVLFKAGAQTPNPMVPWTAIKRWTWSGTPALQLNLYDGQAIHSIVVDEFDKKTIEQLLVTRVGHE